MFSGLKEQITAVVGNDEHSQSLLRVACEVLLLKWYKKANKDNRVFNTILETTERQC
jgi:hypothetical protein